MPDSENSAKVSVANASGTPGKRMDILADRHRLSLLQCAAGGQAAKVNWPKLVKSNCKIQILCVPNEKLGNPNEISSAVDKCTT